MKLSYTDFLVSGSSSSAAARGLGMRSKKLFEEIRLFLFVDLMPVRFKCYKKSDPAPLLEPLS
jgi:hypothetical protein